MPFDQPPSHTHNEFFDFLVSCIDPRFTALHTRHMLSLGREGKYSDFSIAGGALAAILPQNPAWATTLWENLALSMKIHGVNRLVLLGHQDCAAIKQWAETQPHLRGLTEHQWHQAVFANASTEAMRRFPKLVIECRIISLSGDVASCDCQAAKLANTGAPKVERRQIPGAAAQAHEGFAEFVRTATRKRNFSSPDETQTLAIGVTEYGLTADQAREIYLAQDNANMRFRQSEVDEELLALLRVRADSRGFLSKKDVELSIAFIQRRSANRQSRAEAEHLVRAMMLRENLRQRRLFECLSLNSARKPRDS